MDHPANVSKEQRQELDLAIQCAEIYARSKGAYKEYLNKKFKCIYKVCEYESDKTYAYWDPENPEDKQRRWLEPSVLHYLRCHELQPPVMYTSLLYDLAYRTKP